MLNRCCSQTTQKRCVFNVRYFIHPPAQHVYLCVCMCSRTRSYTEHNIMCWCCVFIWLLLLFADVLFWQNLRWNVIATRAYSIRIIKIVRPLFSVEINQSIQTDIYSVTLIPTWFYVLCQSTRWKKDISFASTSKVHPKHNDEKE